jgi:hypothetical protein
MLRRVALIVLVGVAGCDHGMDLPACTTLTPLDTSPLADSQFQGLVPLGNLNPPGHTFPTDHLYLYLPPPETLALATLRSPGHSWLTRVQRHSSSTPPAYEDWTLELSPCREVALVLMHVSSLADGLLARVGSVDGHCSEYDTGGRHYRNCEASTDVELQGGEVLGGVGGEVGQRALDFGATDTRSAPLAYVSPGRLREGQEHVVCPLDLFVAEARAALVNRLGSYDGARQRTAEPVCGTVMQDLPGTAQGLWYRPGAPSSPEDPHLALVHDNVDPTIPAFSVGTSVTGLSPGVYTFTPQPSGLVDRDFPTVAPGSTYCWNLNNFYDGYPLGRLVGSFPSVSALRIRYDLSDSCGGGPWTVGSEGTTFER